MVCSTRDEPNLSAPPPRQSTPQRYPTTVSIPQSASRHGTRFRFVGANYCQSSIVNPLSFGDFYLQYELLPRALELFQDNECRLPQRPVRRVSDGGVVWNLECLIHELNVTKSLSLSGKLCSSMKRVEMHLYTV
jgi:hypothetical protein